ncbi:hypothetical protein [Hyphobacterium marinum]|uniref:Uncharacterized protein n=1 Tax=Hyphobacterium marinum TaxID=3116574 RepID=A0ABU7LYY1_9PROT|nr:hypothetical protein [Hyphobacterium sp. Y6023]MEE2566735.1 hypothetical protein [Hyphobacterium sp. Y6023]
MKFFGLAALATLALPAVASAQSLEVRLMTAPEAIAGPAQMLGPLDVAYPSSDGMQPPAPLPVSTLFEQAVMPGFEITAMAAAGDMAVNFPAQPLDLSPVAGQIIPCSHGRACTVTLPLTQPWPAHDLTAFTVTLDAGLPDPDGGCLTVSGYGPGAITAANAAFPARVQTIPNLPPALPSGAPAEPFAPLPETYLVQPPMSASLLLTGSVSLLVCGDAPDGVTGTLDYAMTQGGSNWSWSVAGRWTLTIENGEAVFRHTLQSNDVTGMLLSAETGHVGDVVASASETAQGWRVTITPDPDLADPVVQTFREREAMGMGGREIEQETNHPAVIALSYLFREYLSGGGSAEFVETSVEGVDVPSGLPPVSNGTGVSLDLHWTFGAD